MNRLGIPSLEEDKIALIVIDIQEKFIPVIHEIDFVMSRVNLLTKAAEKLQLPVVATEQYPKGLGPTSAKIFLPRGTPRVEKTCFSCFGSELFREQLEKLKTDTLLICGVESHVCVLQTALDGVRQGFQVHVALDAVSSRRPDDKQISLHRFMQSGVLVSSSEIFLFQLLQKAKTPAFQSVSPLFK